MSDDANLDEVVHQLEQAFGSVLKDCFSELPPSLGTYAAMRLCEVLKDELRGMRVTVPSRPRFDRDAIAADWRAGLTLSEIIKRHRCSKATAFRYHPQKRCQA